MGLHARVLATAAACVLLAVSGAHAQEGTPTAGEVNDPATRTTEVATSSPSTGTAVAAPDKDAGLAPVVHCAWVLPDMGGDPADGQQYDLGGLADDLPDVPSPTPCDLGEGGAPVPLASGAVASVRPNGGDAPGERRVELWAAVGHATGPGSVDEVQFTVRSPAGEVLDTTAVETLDCASLAVSLDAAVRSGQITAAAATSEWGLAGLCASEWLLVARSTLSLSHRDACGVMTLEVTAVDGDRRSTVSTPFEVLCFHQLVTDFDAIDWGALVPGAETIAEGDDDLATADRPTIANLGNAPMAISTTFQPLCLVDDPETCTGRFGVEVTPTGRSLARAEPAEPATELLLEGAALCAGDTARVDFVVAVDGGLRPGDYRGSVRVLGTAASGCETGGEPSADPGDPGATTTPAPAPPTSEPVAVETSIVDTAVQQATTVAPAPVDVTEPTPSSVEGGPAP